MILRSTVEKVMDTARIEEVVRSYVDLKNRGSNLIGLCPFHREKTPSFTVSPSRNIFKCFGCAKAGDPVRFVMEIEQLSFPEAIRSLAKRYNIPVEETVSTEEDRSEALLLESLNIVNAWACQHYQDQLWSTDLGKSIGLNYFKERGFLEQTLKTFEIGFAPDESRCLADAAEKGSYSKEMLQKAGLINSFGSDFFRNRVIFPIHHQSGKVIGFAGRIMGSEQKLAKYINSPETEVYKKSKTLFGLHLAKQAIRRQDRTLLVEGYTDVMSLHQAGIENVVASSGTSLTEEQSAMLKRHSQNVTILYDGDAAGVKAALRGIDILLREGLNIQVALIPDGDDPDSYLRKVGAAKFEQFLREESNDLILFKIRLLQDENKNDPVSRSNAVHDILSSIAIISDPIKRSIYLQEAARLLQMDEATLIQSTNKLIQDDLKQQAFRSRRDALERDQEIIAGQEQIIDFKKEIQLAAHTGDEYQEKEIIRVLMLAGDKAWNEESPSVAHFTLENIQDILEYFDNPLYLKIIEIIRNRLQQGEPVNTTFFIQHADQEISGLAIDLCTSPFVYSENWEKKHGIFMMNAYTDQEYRATDIEKLIKHLKYRKIDKLLRRLDTEIATLEENSVEEMIKVRETYRKLKNDLFKEVWNLE